LIFTLGGTGFSPRDVTPEATRPLLERPASGIIAAMISNGVKTKRQAMLSRPAAGIRKKSFIVNLPGSSSAVLECLEFLMPVLPHGIKLLQNINDKH